MNPINSISQTSIKLLLSEPFYGHFLMGLPKEISTKVKSIALALMPNQSIKLMVNERSWESLEEDYRYGLLKHEILHLVLKHPFRIKNYSNKILFHLAADLVVNQYIDRQQLPGDAILLEQFAYLYPMYKISLEPDRGIDYYYHQLDKALKMKAQMSFENAVVNIRPAKSQRENQRSLGSLVDFGNVAFDEHKFWKAFGQRSEGERMIAEHQVNRMLQQTADRVRHKYENYGNLPQGLGKILTAILKKLQPQVNWRRQLRLFATSSNSTFIKNTIRRPSKRYDSVPGTKVKRRNRLLLAIDTSGSIDSKELKIFFGEVHSIWRLGAELRIVECDTTIHKTYDYKGIPPEAIQGRGETSFEAPIQYGNDIYHPDALIYFTDGYAKVPKTLSRYPVLWVISADGLKENEGIWKALLGSKLKIIL